MDEAIAALKAKVNDPEVDFEIEADAGKVRLVKVRTSRTVLTNWVTPQALGNYIAERASR